MTGQKVIAKAKVVRFAGEDCTVVGIQFEGADRNFRGSLLSSLRRLKSQAV